MTEEQEAHLQRVKDWICARIDAKYRKGQAEHGGDLWKKKRVFEFLLDEVTDFVVYAETHQEQLNNPSIIDPNALGD